MLYQSFSLIMLSHENAIKKLDIADLFRLDPIRDLTTVYYVHIKVIIVYLNKRYVKVATVFVETVLCENEVVESFSDTKKVFYKV